MGQAALAPDEGPLKVDLCVIGAGAAGLAVATAAALLGARVALVDAAWAGGAEHAHGDLAVGALIAAARAADAVRKARGFGIHLPQPQIDGAAVMNRVRRVIADLAPERSAARCRAMGIRVITARARFLDGRTLEAGGLTIRARRFVIATGARPALPAVPGLAEGPVLTVGTLGDLQMVPQRLVVLGGTPAACELAQAFQRLGATVALIETGPLLATADADAARALRRALLADGVALFDAAQDLRFDRSEAGGLAVFGHDNRPQAWRFDSILVAGGHTPDIDALDLDKAGVAVSPRGILTSGPCRTSNRRIHAIGACAEAARDTGDAAQQAGVVVRHALFALPARPRPDLVPELVRCAPESAAVGLGEAEARAADPQVRVTRWPLSETGRARLDNTTTGFVKVMASRKGRLLGVVIVAPNAGDLIGPWTLALGQKLDLARMADLAMPSASLSEATRRAALQGLADRLGSPWLARLRRLVRLFG